VRHRITTLALTLAVALTVFSAEPRAKSVEPLSQPPEPQMYSPELTAAFDQAYSLDFAEALAAARAIIAKHPDDPSAYRAVATVTWLQMLFARGGTFIDHYLGKVTKMQFNMPKPPPELDGEFLRMVDKAVTLSEAQVRARPRDAQAQFNLGASWALRAGYVGSVQGSVTGAFSASRHAYNAHERALDLNPTLVEANFVVGMYRYAISTLGLPTRMLAYMAGFGGGKERGIQMIEIASKSGSEQADALFALAVIYSREGRHMDAVLKLRELERRYPRNRILVLEEGAALIRAGHADTADAVLTAGLERLDEDPRPHSLGERGYWLYKRGLARLHWNHRAEAALDLDAALTANPVGWVRGRIHVTRGQLADLNGRREEALAEYRLGADWCGRNNDPFCVADAVQFTRRPFALQ
jgi:tetratricopeptide (TPR) repeat protein